MKRKIQISVILCGSSAVLILFARMMDGFADFYYEYVYRYVATLFAYVFGWLPVSVSELLLYAILGTVLFCLLRFIVRKVKKKKSDLRLRERFLHMIVSVTFFASMMLFLFTINCGVNYHKKAFVATENFQERRYSKKELETVCRTLTKEINKISKQLPKTKTGETDYSENREGRAKNAMKAAAKKYKSLEGYFPNPKGVLVSPILSYQQVTGIYSPFTVEANYNTDMPDYLKPFTMCHELSHLRGIMREGEANFVAFLACMNSSDDVVRYSGLMHAYSYCMNELYGYDVNLFKAIRKELCNDAHVDIQQKLEFWEKYDTKVAKVANKMNDAYLKANAQAQGTNSYNQVTGLIVEYFRKK